MASNKLIKQCFDLTTEQGLKNSFSFLASSPILYLGVVLKSIFDSKRTESQAEVAEHLIKKGKEDGVDEMEIIMDNSRGINFKAPIEGIEIGAKVGSDEKMHIKVKYK